jgi:hypothetical protein
VRWGGKIGKIRLGAWGNFQSDPPAGIGFSVGPGAENRGPWKDLAERRIKRDLEWRETRMLTGQIIQEYEVGSWFSHVRGRCLIIRNPASSTD